MGNELLTSFCKSLLVGLSKNDLQVHVGSSRNYPGGMKNNRIGMALVKWPSKIKWYRVWILPYPCSGKSHLRQSVVGTISN